MRLEKKRKKKRKKEKKNEQTQWYVCLCVSSEQTPPLYRFLSLLILRVCKKHLLRYKIFASTIYCNLILSSIRIQLQFFHRNNVKIYFPLRLYGCIPANNIRDT